MTSNYYFLTNNNKRPEFRVESWRLEETCCHSNSSEKPANTDVKNSRGVNNNINNNNNNGYN